ncbi:MAG: LysR family transcriptional regulator, partial [Chloroflexi bacterium]|nr:LysR family transcriptional regulator [Chloroflexota bacterium]
MTASIDLSDRGICERWVRSFLAVVDSKGFSQASTACSCPVGQLKDDVRNLASNLGVKLFQGRPASLTPAGRQLLPYLRQISSRLNEVRQVADGSRPVARERVRVRGYPVHVPMIFADVARAFLAGNANGDDVGLEFQEASSLGWESLRDLFAPLMRGDVDVAFGGPPRPPLRYIELYRT